MMREEKSKSLTQAPDEIKEVPAAEEPAVGTSD
jgi:hypothetical protein